MKILCHVMLSTLIFYCVLVTVECEASYCNEETYVFYGNGMFNEQTSDASVDKNTLKVRLRTATELPA